MAAAEAGADHPSLRLPPSFSDSQGHVKARSQRRGAGTGRCRHCHAQYEKACVNGQIEPKSADYPPCVTRTDASIRQ